MFANDSKLVFVNMKDIQELNIKKFDNMFLGTPENMVFCLDEEKSPKTNNLIKKEKACSVLDCSENWKNMRRRIIKHTKQCVDECPDGYKFFDDYSCVFRCPDGSFPENFVCKYDFVYDNDDNKTCSIRNFFLGNCKKNLRTPKQKQKFVDNVTTENLRGDTIKYKQVLAGILVDLQKQIFDLLKSDNTDVDIYHEFITNKLNIKFDKKLTLDEYRKILNRPLRVCGVVKNTGAPGGGPFWVMDENGMVSLQIVESSQIAPESKHIMQESSYFNPVDLVCATKDYMGNKFDLNEYIDKKTGFISEKSKNGVPLRAMERPGLWNGAMAKWNTVLVAVPGTTFTPVKVVSDLLSTPHQTKK